MPRPTEDWQKQVARRKRIQFAIWAIVVVVIVGGMWWPLLGFVVPIVMLTGIIGGFFKGRYVCGWLCPRGAFLERIVGAISPLKARLQGRARRRRGQAPIRPEPVPMAIPMWLRRPAFRWAVFAALMGFMAFQTSQDPGDVYHWGRVFVRICIITTAIGVVLAIAVHPRTWCSFCPMGTMQSAVGGSRAPLMMADGCVECRACERACPMNLKIVGQRNPTPLPPSPSTERGRAVVNAPDCLKCGECVVVCPKRVLGL